MGRTAGRLVGVVLVTAALLVASPVGAPAAPPTSAGWRAPLAPAATSAGQSWEWPLRPDPEVVAGFRAPPSPWGPGHRGVDLAAGVGAHVLAPADGVVAFAGVVAGRGVVAVQHPGGLRTSLEPVTALLPVGTPVTAGASVARLDGPTGSHCAPASCLHWGVRRHGVYVDPLSLLRRGAAVLLPVYASVSGGRVTGPAPRWR